MTTWDPDATTRLQQQISSLRDEGVVDMFERIVARVWKFNVDRHEPTEIGDTNRSLGINASENIRTLSLRERWKPDREANTVTERIHIDAPNDSLRVRAPGLTVRIMKSAAAPDLKEPRWDDAFNWKAESDVRLNATRSNMGGYNPFLIGPGGLFEDLFPPTGSVAQLREAFLIWSGGSDSPFTAGWLGFPTTGERPWLAIENLWWHGPGRSGALAGASDGVEPDGDSFTTREAPEPSIKLKRRDRASEQ